MFWLIGDDPVDNSKKLVFDSNTNTSFYVTDNKINAIMEVLNEELINAYIRPNGSIEHKYSSCRNVNYEVAKIVYKDKVVHKLVSNTGRVTYIEDGKNYRIMKNNVINFKYGKMDGCVEYDNTNIQDKIDAIDKYKLKNKLLGNDISLEYYIEEDNVILDRLIVGDNINHITIPNVVTSLGCELTNTFNNKSIKRITIPDSVKYIGNFVFTLNKDIKIEMGKNVEYIYDGSVNSIDNMVNISEKTKILKV